MSDELAELAARAEAHRIVGEDTFADACEAEIARLERDAEKPAKAKGAKASE